MAHDTTTAPAVPDRDVRTRRIAFAFEDTPRHWVAGEVLQSHITALGSAVFPEGEDFFVRSVRRYRDQIEDPRLRKQVAGFIGQEAMHGRSHRDFNDALKRLGYPTRFVDRFVRVWLWIHERLLSGRAQLAITAALEHYTATAAHVLLTEPEARDAFATEEARSLFVWHALEETEHKAVAFDVYQAVGGRNWVRVWTMRVWTLYLLLGITAGMAISLVRDGAAWNPRRMRRSWQAMRRSPFARREVLQRLRDYRRRDFHPDDHDDTELIAEWRERLFGTQGPLHDRVGAATG